MPPVDMLRLRPSPPSPVRGLLGLFRLPVASGVPAVTDDLLTVKEAAHYLGGVSVSTVHRLVGRGQLRKVKIGGSTRFRRSELDRYLRAAEREAVRGRVA